MGIVSWSCLTNFKLNQIWTFTFQFIETKFRGKEKYSSLHTVAYSYIIANILFIVDIVAAIVKTKKQLIL